MDKNVKNKITSVTSHITGEGHRLSYTYSVVDINGTVVSDNNRKTIVVIDGINEENDQIIECIKKINNYALKKLEADNNII